jgi:hypothetical protein
MKQLKVTADDGSSKYIFLNNISFFEIKENEVFITFRNIIKVKKLKIEITPDKLLETLKNEKLNKYIKLGPNLIINQDRILVISEDLTKESKKSTIWLKVIFETDYTEVELNKEFWAFWKKQYLKF